MVTEVFPYPLQSVLTDNGSEFMKHFDEEIRRLHKTHWHTYPRTPKMNAHVERFNRTFRRSSLIIRKSCSSPPMSSTSTDPLADLVQR